MPDFPVVRRRKIFACPHCGEMCVVPVSIQVLEPEKYQDEGTDPLSSLTSEQKKLLCEAENTGVLAAFSQVISNRRDAPPPSHVGKFFLSFLKTAQQKRVPTFVLRHYINEFSGQNVEFWGAQGILAITSNRTLRAFVPLSLVVGRPVRSVVGASGIKGRLSADEKEFTEWVKTRYGYVPSGCVLFLSEMRKKSIGEFASVAI